MARGPRALLAGALLAGAGSVLVPASTAAASTAAAPRTVMILLDTNVSVGAAGFAAEKRVALGYAAALPADVRTGLITFSDHWRLVLRPASDRQRLVAGIRASRAAGVTSAGIAGALSGATAAVQRLGAVARSRLLVLSNAETLAGQALAAAIPTDVVTWYYESDDEIGALRALASATGGHATSPGQAVALAALFQPVPATSQATASSPAPAKAVTVARSGGGAVLIAVLVMVFAALLIVALLLLGPLGSGRKGRDVVAEIERYGPRHGTATASSEGSMARTAVGLTTQLLRSSNVERGLAQRLDLAGIGRTPAEWALLGGSAGAALSAVLTLLLGNAVIGILAGMAAGWLGMRLMLTVRIDRRRAKFRDQLPDVLQLIAGSLRSGLSLAQALDAVVREDTQPTAGEFARALAEARIGLDLTVALDGVAARMDSTDLRWTAMAIRIQREVGGNLAEILANTVATMRERTYLRRHVRALSAEGRLSAYILIALPLLMGSWLFLTDRSYLSPLFTTPVGLLMVLVSAVLFVLGVLWMRAAVKVEV